ncbi:uncharacterized protein LOC123297344 [Chrysoperla carnea]|uniref:uncharacterized protein LOC123297344 n=1 Tax=Chrysoperla carnea TaxID=189513 RepID=UPI001D063AC8|nr:uncharacterized protein LOC123297344 [Chrysoperla carnea]
MSKAPDIMSEINKKCNKLETDKSNDFESSKSSVCDIIPSKSRLMQLPSAIASNFRRASSHLNLTSESSSTSKKCDLPETSSPNKKSSKWMKKFNCAKLKCMKQSISNDQSHAPVRNKTKSKNCLCQHCPQKTVDLSISGFGSSELSITPEVVVTRTSSSDILVEDNVKDVKISDSSSEPSTFYGSVANSITNGASCSSNLGETSNNVDGETSGTVASSNKNDKWVQIIYPSETTEDIDEEDDTEEFHRHSSTHSGSIMITQHICGRAAYFSGEKKAFQLICPPEVNVEALRNLLQSHFIIDSVTKCHTQVDFIHYLVPDLRQITSCSFYWGKMDRYEAERLLDGKPEGTFLLRDSAQDEFLFSVSFRKYGRSLHARIEQYNHKFSFDSHDPAVYASDTVCGLIEHYKDPSCCMFFEPILTLPLHRNFTFTLQHLCRSIITSHLQYDTIDQLQLPHVLKIYLKEYHYRQKVCVKRFDLGEVQSVDL